MSWKDNYEFCCRVCETLAGTYPRAAEVVKTFFGFTTNDLGKLLVTNKKGWLLAKRRLKNLDVWLRRNSEASASEKRKVAWDHFAEVCDEVCQGLLFDANGNPCE